MVAGKKVLFIDEAQMIESTGLVIKLLVDNFPEVQVVATGSSSFELSDRVKESAVGRVVSTTLLPLSAEELSPDNISRAMFDTDRMMRLGGYPRSILSSDDRAVEALQDITDSYIYKDILNLADIRDPEVLPKLLSMLALQVGQEVSYDELANMLDIRRETVERYIQLLEASFIVFRLNPISSNSRKVLASRKRKIYFYDLGVRNILAGQINLPALNSAMLGGVFENFVILERKKALLNRQIGRNVNYWRSPDSEIDYIEQYDGGVYGYEIKLNKHKQAAPPLFTKQFPDAEYKSVARDSYWDLISLGFD